MFENWIDVLLRGTYELALPSLTFAHNAAGTSVGSGRLLWDGTTIRLHGHTDNAEGLRQIFGVCHAAPGELVPHDTYLRPTGRTQDGWELTASPETLDGFSVTSTSPHVIWDIPTRRISLREQRSNRGPRTVRALIGPSPDSWTRGTETQVQNDFFGGTSSSLDWLQFAPQFGIVAARRRSPEWFEVYLQIDAPPESDDADQLLTAVRWAFGFAMGRECIPRGHVEYRTDTTIRSIRTGFPAPSRQTVLPPIPCQWSFHREVEQLLARATDFFLTKQGKTVAQYLWLWSSPRIVDSGKAV